MSLAVCLHNVFHEFGTVGADPIPFLSGGDSLVGDAGTAKIVDADTRFYVAKVLSGWRRNKKHALFAGEGKPMRLSHRAILHRFHDRLVHISPKADDIRIGVAPVFMRIPCDYSCLDGGKVRDDELAARFWDKGRPHQLG